MYDPSQKYTIDEYWKCVETFPDRKFEYVDGDIRMMTGGSPAHAQIGMNIGSLLMMALRDRECNVYNSDAVVQLTDSREYCPDVTVSCDPADWTRKKALEAPTVVVEVLSPTTERTDRVEKLIAYQLYPTIQEIVFVDSRKRFAEHYHRIGVSKWEDTIYTHDEDVIELTSIDVSLTVKDVYFKVYLELEENTEGVLMIDSPVTRAFQLAADLHARQKRKASLVPGTPYLSHLMEVAAIVMAIDPTEEVVAAALLHDVIEDQGAETRDLVLTRLGPRVLALVEECTEPGTGGTTKSPWLERKRGYLEHVRSASLEALIITCGDKLQNLRDLRKQVAVYGEVTYASFDASKADKLWFYSAVLDAARQRAAEFKAQQPASPIFVALDYLFHEQEELLSYLDNDHTPLDALSPGHFLEAQSKEPVIAALTE